MNFGDIGNSHYIVKWLQNGFVIAMVRVTVGEIMFESDFLSDLTWIMPVGNNAFMLDTCELPKIQGYVWYRRIRYQDIKKRNRSARIQIRLQNANFYSGTRMSVAHYKRCQFWDRLGRFGVLIRKIAAVAFTRNAATAGREQSIDNRKDGDTQKQVAGPL